jgi:hypothetical protein
VKLTHIFKKIDTQNNLTLFSVSGKVSAGEIVAAIRDFYEDGVTANVFWDLTDSDLSEISASDVKHIASLSGEYPDKRASGKTAIVGPDDLSYGLLRMYETIKDFNKLPFSTKAFRNIDEAYEWLAESQPKDSSGD